MLSDVFLVYETKFTARGRLHCREEERSLEGDSTLVESPERCLDKTWVLQRLENLLASKHWVLEAYSHRNWLNCILACRAYVHSSFIYRQDAAKRSQPVFKFTQWLKITIFPLAENYELDENSWQLLEWARRALPRTTMLSLGAIEQRAPAVGAKMWCLYVCFCHAPRQARCSFEGVYFEQVSCRCLWVDFDAIFSVFNRQMCAPLRIDSWEI